MDKVLTAVLGGGQGARLSPLTRYRAKPAVPMGGKFRLIDIPLSNSLHAHIDRIYVLTQFNSESLHRHIAQTYRFDHFSHGFVNILAAEQTVSNTDWYQGTADAVRQNLDRLSYTRPQEVLILSGDQLYLMDLRSFVERHREKKADLTIAVKPVSRAEASGLGIMRMDRGGRIVEFVEKPQGDELLERLTPRPETLAHLGFEAPEGSLLASMGIYVFRRETMEEILRGTSVTDFGREVIPAAIHEHRVYAFNHPGYWADIGTIPAFHEANISFSRPLPPLNMYSREYPIYTHPRFLPPTKINRCTVQHAILSEGSILFDSQIERSIIGLRAVVRENTVIRNSYVMGANDFSAADEEGGVPLGVGPNCVIENAILDLNVRVGEGSRLVNEEGVDELDGELCSIRGGIIVVAKDTVIPPGTVI